MADTVTSQTFDPDDTSTCGDTSQRGRGAEVGRIVPTSDVESM
jgi:hypothetical protein